MNSNPQASAITEERPTYQNVGLALGPALFALMMLFSGSQTIMDPVAWKTAAISLWMAAWWATEALPVSVTACLPIVVFEPLGIKSLREAAEPYSNPIIYLYLGGFLLALAVERWNLHRRVALFLLSLTGTDGVKLIGGFMLASAFLSMWMTNTSTTLMLLPIALSVVGTILDNQPDLTEKQKSNFQIAMLLGLAYSATIGGLATLVGTPPNALLVGFMNENYDYEISFLEWMAVGLPVSMILLPIAWLTLTKLLYPVNIPESKETSAYLQKLRDELGPMTLAEKRVAIIFSVVVVAWMLRKPIAIFWDIPGLSDPGIVMAAAILLFIIPSGNRHQPQLMTWHEAGRLPWGVLLLFGGGLSLAAAVADSGLALWLGHSLAPLGTLGVSMLVLASVLLVVLLTELTSNLATTATLLPIMGAIAIEAGIDPLMLCVPIAMAASCAFMLPVATPPNAIVFSSGFIKIPQMAKAGILMNIIGVLLLTLLSIYWVPHIWG
ncbi:DASS family sodium-coupled anion symporter [Paraglaciecola sp.]|uniref:SLC13 family permease n=2 Tax=Paraglaciecola sp. TaxID=1920173 RepID=UPI003265F7F9